MGLYPDAPGAMNYSAGLADFSGIGNLPGDYYKTQEQKRQFDVVRTFQGGLPRDAAGNIDFNRAAEMLATKGDASQLVPLANVDMQRKFLGSALSDSKAAFPTGQPSPGPQSAAPQATPSGSFADRTAAVESGGNPTAKNPNSSASGPYQFTNATWLENFDKAFPQAAAGLSPQQKLAVRDNPQLRGVQDKVFQTFTAGNESALKDAGVPINDTTRYAAHFFGAGDAPKVLKAPASTPLADLVQPETLQANSFLQGMTAGQARAWLAQKMPGGAEAASAFAAPERPAIPPHGIPQGSADGSPPPAAPVRVAGPAMTPGPPSGASGPATAPASPQATPQPQAGAQPQPAPQPGPMPDALRPMIPAQFNDPMQYVNFLRQKQASYEAAGLVGVKGADGAAKAYGAQADKIMDAINKEYERTPEQKNAAASGGLNPLTLENAKQAGRVAAENQALTEAAKNFQFDQRLAGAGGGQPGQGTAPAETLVEQQARAAGAKKQAEGEAERYGKRYDAIQESGSRALADLPQLDLAKKLMDDPNFYSGVGEKYNLVYKRLLSTFGSDPNVAAPQEAFRKIIAASILDQIKGLAGTGQIRVAEIKIMEQAAANAENTPAANKILVEIASRLQQRAADLAAIAQNYKDGRLDQGFDRLVRMYDQGKMPEQTVKAFGLQRQGSLLTEDEIKSFRELIKPPQKTEAPSAASQAPKNPPSVGAVEQGYRFKGGDPGKPESWERVQ